MQAVRQVENDFAAIRVKVERVSENVLLRIVARKVEAFPIGAVDCPMPLHGAVVSGNSRIPEAESCGQILLNAELRIDAQQVFQFFQRRGKLQDGVVQRRHAGAGDKPIRTDVRQANSR